MTRVEPQPTLAPPHPLLRQGASRTAALFTLCAMQLMIILDGTIVTVALPTIQGSLGFSASGLAWVVNGYLVAFAGLLLLAGRMGDLFGTARVFTLGVIIFTVASLLCGLAQTPTELLAGRGLQGVGGAFAAAVILGMIVRLYSDAEGRARGIAVYSGVSAAGAAIGLICGGVLTQTLGWQADFMVNVPIGLLAVLTASTLFSDDRVDGEKPPADYLGGVLVTAGLCFGVLTILRASEVGWASRTTAVTAFVALISLMAFVAWQARTASPLLPLRVFRQRQPTVGNIASVFVFAAGFGFQYLTALYLQRILGLDALQTGLAFLPVPILIGVLSMSATPKLISQWGIRTVLVCGLGLLAAALVLLSRVPTDGSYVVDVLPALLLSGVAMALALPGATVAAMSTPDPADAGLASGLANTMQQGGAAVGLAVVASVAAARTAAQSGGSHLAASAKRLQPGVRGGGRVRDRRLAGRLGAGG